MPAPDHRNCTRSEFAPRRSARLWRAAVPAALVLALAGPAAFADVYVHLKDGKTLIVPVDRDAIDYIEITPKGAPSTNPATESEQDQDRSEQSAAAAGPASTTNGPSLPDAAPIRLPEGGQIQDTAVGKPSTYRVGPDQKFKRIGDLAAIARDGDTIEIEPGIYDNDWATWRQNDLTLKGVDGRPHLRSEGAIPNDKAIWIIKGDNVTVENIEFSGAKVHDDNGAGIRAEGGKLTIRNSYFHENEMGILSGNDGKGDITIENSEFNHQTAEGIYAHNIYIGIAKRFRLTGTYSHDADGGHQVKSRAHENYIAYNKLMDGKDGDGSYAIDLPECGIAYIIGNVIQQGVNSDNHTAISYGAEDCPAGNPKVAYIVNNTFVNDAEAADFVTNHTMTPVLLRNNLIVGIGHLADGPVTDDNNLLVRSEALVNREGFDYHLAKGAAAIDKGIAPGKAASGLSLVPTLEYKDGMSTMPRPSAGKLDIGAYEYTP
jgi:Right handed beta helix region